MPKGQALIDMLASAISVSNVQQTHRNFDVNYDQLRQTLKAEADTLRADETREDNGTMTVGQAQIETRVLIGGNGDISDGIADGKDVELIPDPPPTAVILIAYAGNGMTPTGRGGRATVRGGFECLCIAIGGHAGDFQLPTFPIQQPTSGTGAPGSTGPDGGVAVAEGPNGAELWAIGGNGGKGGTGQPGAELFYHIPNLAAVTPTFLNVRPPGRGGNGGAGGVGGWAIVFGGDDNGYARAVGGRGGEAGDFGRGGPAGGLPVRAPTPPRNFPAGPPGSFGIGGAGGSTFVLMGPNGYREATPGTGGPGSRNDPSANTSIGPNGLSL